MLSDRGMVYHIDTDIVGIGHPLSQESDAGGKSRDNLPLMLSLHGRGECFPLIKVPFIAW